MNGRSKFFIVAAGVLAAGLFVGSTLSQDDMGMGAPKPGAEHALLKKYEGAWDATNEMMGMTTKATFHCKLACNGFWLMSEYKGDFGGGTFTGYEQMGYDTAKKKYVSTWIDSMSTGIMMMEGSFDAATKTITMTGEGPDMTGKIVRHTGKTTWADDNTFIYTMSAPGPDGKEAQMMKITYKRKTGK